ASGYTLIPYTTLFRSCCLLAVTPADELGARAADPFCGSAVLGAINELADFSHSKAIADLISDNSKAKEWEKSASSLIAPSTALRSEEHTSELQSRGHL